MARKLRIDQQKKRILATLAESDNLTQACAYAQCTKAQYRAMCAENVITSQELADAKAAYADRVLEAANKAALEAPLVPLVRYKTVVRDVNGQPIMQQNIDVNALRFLIERLEKSQEKLTEQAREAGLLDESIPAQYRLLIDARLLKEDELSALKEIAEAIERRKKNHDYYITHQEKWGRNGHNTNQDNRQEIAREAIPDDV